MYPGRLVFALVHFQQNCKVQYQVLPTVELSRNANTTIFGEIRELTGTSRVELAMVASYCTVVLTIRWLYEYVEVLSTSTSTTGSYVLNNVRRKCVLLVLVKPSIFFQKPKLLFYFLQNTVYQIWTATASSALLCL